MVDDDTLGFLKYMVNRWMHGFALFDPVFDLAIGRNILHWARTVQGHKGHDVLDTGRFHPLEGIHHAAGFHLENRDRLGTGVKLIGSFVIQRDSGDIVNQPLWRVKQLCPVGGHMQVPPRGLDLIHRVLDDGQRLQTQKVEFDQTCLFDPFHVELGRGHVRSRVLIQWHQRIQRTITDYDPRRMGRRVAQQPLDLLTIVKQPRYDLFVAGLLAQTRLVCQRLFDTDGFHPLDRNHFRQSVYLAVGHLQDPPDVAHRRLGQKRTKGDDLPDLVAAIFALHILDHLLAAIHTKIDVKVGHRYPLGVKKAFKKQLVPQRVQIGDRQRIGHQRSGPRPAPWSDRYVLILCPFNEIRNDQEIAGKPHAFDDPKLEIQAFFIFPDTSGMRDHLEPVL